MPLQDLQAHDIKLPSPPAIAVRILEAVRRQDSSFRDLARVIAADPALTVKLLKVANSSFYGLSNKVSSVEGAVSILGIDAVTNIALSFVIARDLQGKSGPDFNFDLFWKRSVTTAVSAKLCATRLGVAFPDAFVCGLLQDIGMLVIYLSRPEDYRPLLDEIRHGNENLQDAEQQALGFDHQQVGAELLRYWQLSPAIWGPLRTHHDPAALPAAYRQQGEVLQVAGFLSALYNGSEHGLTLRRLTTLLKERWHLPGEEIEALLDAVAENSIELFEGFEIDPGQMMPYSLLLQEANEELGRLNLSYEQLVVELKLAKQKAEGLAKNLQQANQQLQEIANRDGLTGLFNYRYFQEALDLELERSRRYKRPFSLFLFDLDRFKAVNDTYGHQGGDIVLRAVGELVPRAMRSSDLIARYGGEEFAVILPETDLAGAEAFAERLRLAIENMVVDVQGNALKVTISIGVTSFDPARKGINKFQLVDAADRGLYTAKHGGRNCVVAVDCGMSS